jgi:hypothetical protein
MDGAGGRLGHGKLQSENTASEKQKQKKQAHGI